MRFYALQIPSYYARDIQFHYGSGLSLGWVIQLPHGVLVVKLAAIAALALIVYLMARRRS